jgi:hypothetical protein
VSVETGLWSRWDRIAVGLDLSVWNFEKSWEPAKKSLLTAKKLFVGDEIIPLGANPT